MAAVPDSIQSTMRPLSIRTPLAVAVVALFAAVGWLAVRNTTPATIFFANDQATDFIIARLIAEGEKVLLGPPSHVGGRHLSPLYYWFVTLSSYLSHWNPASTVLTMTVLKLVLGVALAALVSTVFGRGRTLSVAMGSLLVLSSGPYMELLRVPWHSHFLILPSAFAVFTTLFLLKSGAWAIPILAAGLSTLAASHLSSAPVVLGLVLVGFFGLLLTKGSGYSPFRPRPPVVRTLQVLAIVLIALLWTPLIVYESLYPSNLGHLLQVHHSPETTIGLYEAFQGAVRFTLTHVPLPASSLARAAMIMLALYVAYTYLKDSKARAGMVLAALLAPIAVTALFVSRFKSPLFIHYFNSNIALPLLLFGLVFSQAFRLAAAPGFTFRRCAASLFLCLSLIVSCQKAFSSFRRFSSSPYPPFHTLAHAFEVSELLASDGGESFRLFPALASKLARNSYYFALNNGDLSLLHYREFFQEIGRFQLPPENYAKAYLIMCPAPFSKERKKLEGSLEDKWTYDGEVALSGCSTCRKCAVSRYKNREE